MTRTSQALKRLGVAAIAVATIGAGVPALVATSASATNATNTGVTITPTTEAAQIGTCNPYTVQVTPADTTTVDIQISQTVATGTATIGFCDPGTGEGAAPQAAPTSGQTTTTDLAGFIRPTAGSQCAAPSPGNSTTTCDGEFNTNNKGQLTVGVTSDTVGTLSVTAFVEASNGTTAAAYNTTGNNVPDGTDKSAAATKYLVKNADLAVTSIACEPATQAAKANTTVQYTCTAYSTQGSNTKVPVRGVTINNLISSGPDKTPTTSPVTTNDTRIKCGQPDSSSTATQQPVITTTASGTKTNNQGQVTCEFTGGTTPGTDTIVSYVEQNGTAGPQSTEPNTSVKIAYFGEGRFIACSPKTVDAAYGQDATIACTVTDVNGNPVQGTFVDFAATFPGGRFTDTGSFFTSVKTNSSGVATVKINNPDQTTTQSQTVTASIASGYNSSTGKYDKATAECNQDAGKTQSGAPTTATTPSAGNCSDSVTVKYTTTGTPSPTATGTTPAGAKPVLSTSTPDIQPNQQGKLTATGVTANAVYELRCYSRPSTTYFTARTVTAGATDTTVSFTILPGTNTRCYVRPQGDEANASNSVVINVHTTLSLSAYRDGVRQYHFQGTNLPRRSGQLITLYRWARADNNGYCDPHVAANDYTATSTDPNCVAIRTATATTDSSNVWRIDRTFVGSGQFVFMAKTSQNLTNAAGVSNLRLTIIH